MAVLARFQGIPDALPRGPADCRPVLTLPFGAASNTAGAKNHRRRRIAPIGTPFFPGVYEWMAEGHRDVLSLLIVDDDPRVLELAEHAARASGHFDLIATAENGRDALVKVFSGQRMPDVILTDLSMPYMDGFELTQALKQLAATRQIPVLMFSSSGLLYDQQHALEAGCAGFFPKPTTLAGLREVVENAVRIANQVESAAPPT